MDIEDYGYSIEIAYKYTYSLSLYSVDTLAEILAKYWTNNTFKSKYFWFRRNGSDCGWLQIYQTNDVAIYLHNPTHNKALRAISIKIEDLLGANLEPVYSKIKVETYRG